MSNVMTRMDLTPTPRATAIMCLEILRCSGSTHENINWAEQQILKMIITDWPEDEKNE